MGINDRIEKYKTLAKNLNLPFNENSSDSEFDEEFTLLQAILVEIIPEVILNIIPYYHLVRSINRVWKEEEVECPEIFFPITFLSNIPITFSEPDSVKNWNQQFADFIGDLKSNAESNPQINSPKDFLDIVFRENVRFSCLMLDDCPSHHDENFFLIPDSQDRTWLCRNEKENEEKIPAGSEYGYVAHMINCVTSLAAAVGDPFSQSLFGGLTPKYEYWSNQVCFISAGSHKDLQQQLGKIKSN